MAAHQPAQTALCSFGILLVLKFAYLLIPSVRPRPNSLRLLHTIQLTQTLTLVDYEVLHVLLGAAGAPQSLNRPLKDLFLLRHTQFQGQDLLLHTLLLHTHTHKVTFVIESQLSYQTCLGFTVL